MSAVASWTGENHHMLTISMSLEKGFLGLLLLLAVSALEMKPYVGEDFLEKMNSRRLELCQEIPGQRSTAVYIFNLTNPEEFLQKKIPDFDQLGPFVFKETRNKVDCSVTIGNLDVSFKSSRETQLDAGLSQDLELELTTANVAFNRFVRYAEKAETLPSVDLKKFFDAGEVYIRKETSIRRFLIDGFNTSMANAFLRDRHPHNLPELQKDTFTPLEELLYPKEMTVHSDPENIGQIYRIDGKAFEEVESCGPANGGTEGVIFPSGLTQNAVLYFYSEDLCQIIPLKFEQAADFEGIPAFRFVFSDDALDKAACDCDAYPKYEDGVKNCFPPGGVDLKTCQQNLPFIASLPHFLQADQRYTNAVSGLTGDEALHRSYFIIEPVTGHVLESSLKFQLNVNLLKFDYEGLYWNNVKIVDTVYPYVWTDKKFTLAKEIVLAIKSYLEDLNKSTTEAPATVTFENTATPEGTTQTPEATTAADKITDAPPVPTTTTEAATTTTSTTSTTTTTTEPSTSTPSPSHSKDLDSISQKINSMSKDISLFTNLVLVILTLVLIMFVTILVLGYTVNSRKKREINSGF